MGDYATTFAAISNRILHKWFKNPGDYTQVVPVSATYARISMNAAGGQGANWGGGSAFARATVPVTAGETLSVHVGTTSTGSTPGDSYVKRGVNNLCYVDRGRGNGSQGQAALSIGDVTRSGNPSVNGAVYGAPASDAGEIGELGFGGKGTTNNGSGSGGTDYQAADPGGGGRNQPAQTTFGVDVGYATIAAGTGRVCIEFFSSNPGY